MTCDNCRPHEHSTACWDGKPLRSNLVCTARVDLCERHASVDLAAKDLEPGEKVIVCGDHGTHTPAGTVGTIVTFDVYNPAWVVLRLESSGYICVPACDVKRYERRTG